MAEPTVDDYRWLVSAAANPFLQQAASADSSLVALTKRLRKELTPERTHLVLDHISLRERARVKFSDASKMYFTRKLLEQATDDQIANHKATRFRVGESVADLCSGIGGDALALARRGPCLAIDRDPVAITLVEANGRALGVESLSCAVADVGEVATRLDCEAWHIDPDRRVASQRTSDAAYSEPSLEVIRLLFDRVAAGSMKLAPGAELPEPWCRDSPMELEWIGSRRECRQQVVWLGRLAVANGKRTATVVDRNGIAHSFTGIVETDVDVNAVARFVYVPDSTLLASRLAESLASKLGLRATSYGISYFTSDTFHNSHLLEAFEIEEVLPLDVKRLRRLLRERTIGTVEIKTRGVDIDPTEFRKKLQLKGTKSSTLLLFRSLDSTVAALASRV